MDPNKNQGLNLNVNFDTTPILYTDNVSITVNEDGVVLDFIQRLINTNQVRLVSRVGMSRDHARKLLDSLETSLRGAEGAMQSATKKVKLN